MCELFKIARFGEIAVDRGKADIGDGIDPFETIHDELANPRRGHFGISGGFNPTLDARDKAIDLFIGDTPLAAGEGDGALQLRSVKGFAAQITAIRTGFDNYNLAQLDPFKGREPRPAR